MINVGLRWFVPAEAGARYEATMQEAFGVSGASWKGFEFSWPKEAARSHQLQELVGLLQRLRSGRFRDYLRGKAWRSFIPNVGAEDVPAYFTRPERTFGHDLCPVAWYFAQVEPDGDVCFCGDFPDYVIGNVRRQRFPAIWMGEKAQAFRQRLIREPLPICARCCGSYVYGRWKRPPPRSAPFPGETPARLP